MASLNITEPSTAVVFSLPMWAGVAEQNNTDWLQSPIGSNAGIGAIHMGCVDVVVTSAGAATVLDFGDTGTPAAVTSRINPTQIIAVLSVVNATDSAAGDIPIVGFTATTLLFDSDTGGDGDTHRITFLYR